MTTTNVNNDIYHSLGERWYQADDDPVALLRAESKTIGPWVLERLTSNFNSQNIRILDVGCGGGFLTNYLSAKEFNVTGLDISNQSLEVAKKYDSTKKVKYVQGDAYDLPFVNESFDVITSMDFLEHVENPALVVKEISRVLKPGGLFFFHTFNRNWISGFVVIKLVEWLVANTPEHLHVLNLFVKPSELKKYCEAVNLDVIEMCGIRPVLDSIKFEHIKAKKIPKNFKFKISKSKLISYLGYARKQ